MCVIVQLNVPFVFKVLYLLLSDNILRHLLLLSQTHKGEKWIHMIWRRDNKSNLDQNWIGIKDKQVKERKAAHEPWREFDSKIQLGN